MFFNLWPWCAGMWPLGPQRICPAAGEVALPLKSRNSRSGPWLFDTSNYSMDSSVRNFARSTRPWLVNGVMMFFTLPDNGPNSAHWFQKFRYSSVTNAMLCVFLQKACEGLGTTLLLPIMKCFFSDTLIMRNLLIGHELGLIHLILICI